MSEEKDRLKSIEVEYEALYSYGATQIAFAGMVEHYLDPTVMNSFTFSPSSRKGAVFVSV